MRLAKPFYRLPVRFDVARLQREVQALPVEDWVSHPYGLAGNSALRLISVDGGPNDEVDGVMQPTHNLNRSPYLRQVLASFGVAWSRSRLMKLAPHAEVPEHADINYHWYYRVRIHIPVFTQPQVEFRCGDAAVQMQPGEAWIFDNWRRHSVINPTDADRIHLVADTTGSAAFWQFVARADTAALREHSYSPLHEQVKPITERTRLAPVMAPAEVDLLLLDLRAELVDATDAPRPSAQLVSYHALLDGFRRDWRQLYALFGESVEGVPQYAALVEQLRSASRTLAAHLVMSTNQISAHRVLEGRLLRVVLPTVAKPERPIFIVASPRSGSSLLFETLASSGNLCTLGGEAHWLLEDIEALRPGAPNVESNRLTSSNATPAIAAQIVATIASRLLDADHASVRYRPQLRMLEKTPKNVLRIPFLNQVFPDALFIFLWRDPRENLSSIIEAWHSGRWKTYNGLAGFDGPWSLLLPPGWPAMNGRPVEDIAAFQWTSANGIALDDLAQLPCERWISLSYAELIADPQAAITRICRFAAVEVDARLAERLAAPLPLSRFTHTAPQPEKWQRNAALIERVMAQVEPVWRRLQALVTKAV